MMSYTPLPSNDDTPRGSKAIEFDATIMDDLLYIGLLFRDVY